MISFMVFILYLAINLMSHKVDLESADYYQKEISYQDEITAMNNATDLSEKIQVSVDDDNLLLQLPENVEIDLVNVELKRPNDQNEDRRFTIENTLNYTISKSELKKGSYLLELAYRVNGKECLQKERILI